MGVIHVTQDNFQEEVMNAKEPVLIDFWASWCGPCQMLGPTIEEVAKEAAHAKICKVNVDEEPDLASKYGVMSIPTLVVLKNGEVVTRSVGVKPKAEIIAML